MVSEASTHSSMHTVSTQMCQRPYSTRMWCEAKPYARDKMTRRDVEAIGTAQRRRDEADAETQGGAVLGTGSSLRCSSQGRKQASVHLFSRCAASHTLTPRRPSKPRGHAMSTALI